MLIEIIVIILCLVAFATIGIAVKYYKQKHSPFYKKKQMNMFKSSELQKPEDKKKKDR